MSVKRKNIRASISDALIESASDLHEIGVIDKVTMKEFELMGLPQPKEYSPSKIADLRKRLNLSQAALAAVLNTSKFTVQKWESKGAGRKSCW